MRIDERKRERSGAAPRGAPRVSRFRSTPLAQETHRVAFARYVERGPPGTRAGPHPSASGVRGPALVRTRSAPTTCSDRTDAAHKGAGGRRAKSTFTRRRISAVAKRPCLRSLAIAPADRPLDPSRPIDLQRGTLIPARNLAGENSASIEIEARPSKMPIQRDGRADVKRHREIT